MKLLIVVLVAFFSCAKIPTQSVNLSHALKEEAHRMHEMNITLVEYVFKEKKHMVNEFIANEYAPAFVENFIKKLPPDTDVKREMPDIIAIINPRIDNRRDSLLSVLQSQKSVIIGELENEFKQVEHSFMLLQAMLCSKYKNNEGSLSLDVAKRKLGTDRFDLPAINNAVDIFITGPGSVSERELVLKSQLRELLKAP